MIELYDKQFTGIKSENEIEDAFKEDYAYELIPQNTTDYYTSEIATIKTDDGKYYKVEVHVSMVGSWQDVGDKLYTIESVDKVTYEEIPYRNLVSNYNRRVSYRIQELEKELANLQESLIYI
jgi:hypothetical protein